MSIIAKRAADGVLMVKDTGRDGARWQRAYLSWEIARAVGQPIEAVTEWARRGLFGETARKEGQGTGNRRPWYFSKAAFATAEILAKRAGRR